MEVFINNGTRSHVTWLYSGSSFVTPQNMQEMITGIHHVTAISSNAQTNVDLYAGVLGLRLVKRTINFDAPDVHHLYYGDEEGTPGSIMTFFPYPGSTKGRKGKGQLTVTMFSIPEGSLDYWMQRLERFNVPFKQPQQRYGDEVFISFEDRDGLCLELVVSSTDERKGNHLGPVPPEYSIRGFFGVKLSQDSMERTAGLLTEHLGHKAIKEATDRFRFSTTGKPGTIVDIICDPREMRGLGGNGTVHHLAFATPGEESQLAMRERLLELDLQVTTVMDRQYFRSIYFREPGGVLFEIATEPPGFAIDEPLDSL
ncbi:MAG: VOC family protein, partial [Bacteroidota bacterium]|nr:VOC family protein [Bacteroidota bacterium]